MSRNFHDHIRCSILPPQFAVLPRPVAVNTWEAYHFDVDESKLLLLADKAVALGIDTVVLDDGWFRRNDREKLGDWTADPERFPHGLSYAASEVHKRGLRFGLWFEPEMVSEDSELYRSHPDWIIGNGDKPYLSRNQLVLDFSRPEAVDHIFARMDSILAETQVDFIKWDANRYLSDIVSTIISCAGGETISLQLDTTLPRLYDRAFTVRGTRGLYNQTWHMVYIDGVHEHSGGMPYEYGMKYFNNAVEYEKEFLPMYWLNATAREMQAGHGGMDLFMLRDFADCALNGKPMPIDVFDAAAWMSVTALSEKSIALGGQSVEIPDFTSGRWITPTRGGAAV